MEIELLTKQDLVKFKNELMIEIKQIIAPNQIEKKKWLKSYEVCDMLGICPGILQKLRINGTISYSKLDGLLFYDFEEIMKNMNPIKRQLKKI